MQQASLIQLVSLFILGLLTIFYNPFSADLEGKFIFTLIVVSIILFFVIFDIYNEIKEQKIRIKLFDEKFNLHERIKNLESLNRK
ncbi:MAG: hypothetical protein KJ905_00515 [Nanoarchaeota archaeon]|nr:hypothetical protein [Nanoarchaeota archaeon]MBU1501243.1 hypothetical protein [Nanoarchaeota archaeon]MBU2459130.1 hypothetical protein [Nanoarchaeota archaeon]